MAIFHRKQPITHPIPPPAPVPVPDGATLLALISTSSSVSYSALVAAAPKLEAYAALVREKWAGHPVPVLAVRPFLTELSVPSRAWVAHVGGTLPNADPTYHDVANSKHADLGYHDVANSKPRIWVQAGGGWFAVMTHEIAEAVVNPFIESVDLFFRGKVIHAMAEVCDPVSGKTFGFQGKQVADFVYPSWFDASGKAPFNQRNTLRAPATLDQGGYVTLADGSTVN